MDAKGEIWSTAPDDVRCDEFRALLIRDVAVKA